MNTVSIYGDLLVEIDYMVLSFEALHKNSEKVFVNATGDYCKYFGKFAPVVQLVIGLINVYQSNLFHKCPYVPRKKIGLLDLPVDEIVNNLLNFYPNFFKVRPGEYTGAFNSIDRNGKTIFRFKGYVSVSHKKISKNH